MENFPEAEPMEMDPDGVSGELVAVLVAHGDGGTSIEKSFDPLIM